MNVSLGVLMFWEDLLAVRVWTLLGKDLWPSATHGVKLSFEKTIFRLSSHAFIGPRLSGKVCRRNKSLRLPNHSSIGEWLFLGSLADHGLFGAVSFRPQSLGATGVWFLSTLEGLSFRARSSG